MDIFKKLDNIKFFRYLKTLKVLKFYFLNLWNQKSNYVILLLFSIFPIAITIISFAFSGFPNLIQLFGTIYTTYFQYLFYIGFLLMFLPNLIIRTFIKKDNSDQLLITINQFTRTSIVFQKITALLIYFGIGIFTFTLFNTTFHFLIYSFNYIEFNYWTITREVINIYKMCGGTILISFLISPILIFLSFSFVKNKLKLITISFGLLSLLPIHYSSLMHSFPIRNDVIKKRLQDIHMTEVYSKMLNNDKSTIKEVYSDINSMYKNLENPNHSIWTKNSLYKINEDTWDTWNNGIKMHQVQEIIVTFDKEDISSTNLVLKIYPDKSGELREKFETKEIEKLNKDNKCPIITKGDIKKTKCEEIQAFNLELIKIFNKENVLGNKVIKNSDSHYQFIKELDKYLKEKIKSNKKITITNYYIEKMIANESYQNMQQWVNDIITNFFVAKQDDEFKKQIGLKNYKENILLHFNKQINKADLVNDDRLINGLGHLALNKEWNNNQKSFNKFMIKQLIQHLKKVEKPTSLIHLPKAINNIKIDNNYFNKVNKTKWIDRINIFAHTFSILNSIKNESSYFEYFRDDSPTPLDWRFYYENRYFNSNIINNKNKVDLNKLKNNKVSYKLFNWYIVILIYVPISILFLILSIYKFKNMNVY